MNKKTFTAILLSLFSLTSLAENPSFNYFDIGFVTWRPDGASFSDSPKGLELNVSAEINEKFYFSGDINHVSKNSRSLTLTTIGVGYMNHFSDTSSFFAELDGVYAKPENSDSEFGYEIDFGVRSMVTDKLELKGAIEYIDFDNDNGDLFLNLATAYSFTDNFGAYFEYKINEDLHRFSIGMRYNF